MRARARGRHCQALGLSFVQLLIVLVDVFLVVR
jgi:hypothetical protein